MPAAPSTFSSGSPRYSAPSCFGLTPFSASLFAVFSVLYVGIVSVGVWHLPPSVLSSSHHRSPALHLLPVETIGSKQTYSKINHTLKYSFSSSGKRSRIETRYTSCVVSWLI